jgi:hypothetical protein
MIAAGELMSNAEIERLQELETQYNLVTDRIGAYWMKMVVGIAESTRRPWFAVHGLPRVRAAVDLGHDRRPDGAADVGPWLDGRSKRVRDAVQPGAGQSHEHARAGKEGHDKQVVGLAVLA